MNTNYEHLIAANLRKQRKYIAELLKIQNPNLNWNIELINTDSFDVQNIHDYIELIRLYLENYDLSSERNSFTDGQAIMPNGIHNPFIFSHMSEQISFLYSCLDDMLQKRLLHSGDYKEVIQKIDKHIEQSTRYY